MSLLYAFKQKMKNKNDLLSIIMLVAIFSVLFFLFAFSAIYLYFSSKIPDFTYLKHYDPNVTTRIYNDGGDMVAEYSAERRFYIPINSIPKKLVNAFIAAEDKQFYTHSGIDYVSILKAVVRNVSRISKGDRLVGASTITQQVAKNFLLNSERTFTRKIKEAILAKKIEKFLTKREIIDLYLNEIYLGNRAYGIGAASINYFNKSPYDLTLEEMAYLAVLPKGPNNYQISNNYEKAINRRNWVLSQMRKENFITNDEYFKAIRKPIIIANKKEKYVYSTDYFIEEVRRQLNDKYGYEKLYKGGLYVKTTLNNKIQYAATKSLEQTIEKYDLRHGYRGSVKYFGKISNNEQRIKKFKNIKNKAIEKNWELGLITKITSKTLTVKLKNDKIVYLNINNSPYMFNDENMKPMYKITNFFELVRKHDVIYVHKNNKNQYELKQIPELNGAIVAMEPHSGRILAMSGGWSYNLSKFNRATQAKRQPGSSIKPFVYLTALNNGFTPSSIILDAPFVLELPDGKTWKPNNFSNNFYGPTLFGVGIEKSRNLMTVRLADQVGIDKISQTLKDFGIIDRNNSNLSLALGALETTPLRIATAFSMIVNGGKKITPSNIEMIQDKEGISIYKNDNRSCNNCHILSRVRPKVIDNRTRVADPISAYQITNITQGVIQNGTGKELKSLNLVMAGKTGTTNDSKDTWFVGGTSDLVIVVYFGYDNPKTLGFYNKFGQQETSTSVAVPAAKLFFEQVANMVDNKPFKVPSNVRMVKIDYTSGLVADSTSEKWRWEAFKPGTEPKLKHSQFLNEKNSYLIDNNINIGEEY